MVELGVHGNGGTMNDGMMDGEGHGNSGDGAKRAPDVASQLAAVLLEAVGGDDFAAERLHAQIGRILAGRRLSAAQKRARSPNYADAMRRAGVINGEISFPGSGGGNGFNTFGT